MISIWHKSKPPCGEEVLAITPKAHEYTNIGQVKRQGLVNVFELRNGGFVFLSEVKMWCRLPRDYRNEKSEFIKDEESKIE